MTARAAALIRRWRVWREYSRLLNHHHAMGYNLSAAQCEWYRSEAERRVP